MKQVLVLRPEPGATATAAALRARGYEPVLFPLAEVTPLDVANIDIGRLSAVAATSANGIRYASMALTESLSSLPFFAVGAATAKAARSTGFSRIAIADGDGSALALLVLDRVKPGDRLLYLCGRTRRPDLEQELGVAGIEVVPAETYDVTYPDRTDPFGALLQDGAAPFAVLIHSHETGRAFARVLESAARPLPDLHLVAISERAAEPLVGFGLRIRVAARPNESAMLDVLARLA